MQLSLRGLLSDPVQLHLQGLSLLQHQVHALVQLAPGGVSSPQQTAGGLALSGQWGGAPQGELPTAPPLLLLLEVLGAALQQPGQLLQEGGALSGQRLAPAHPLSEGGLGGQGAAGGLTVALQVGLKALNTVCQPPGSGMREEGLEGTTEG